MYYFLYELLMIYNIDISNIEDTINLYCFLYGLL